MTPLEILLVSLTVSAGVGMLRFKAHAASEPAGCVAEKAACTPLRALPTQWEEAPWSAARALRKAS